MEAEKLQEIRDGLNADDWIYDSGGVHAATFGSSKEKWLPVKAWLKSCVAEIEWLTGLYETACRCERERLEAYGRLNVSKEEVLVECDRQRGEIERATKAEQRAVDLANASAEEVQRLRRDNVAAWNKADTLEAVQGEEIERLRRRALRMVQDAATSDLGTRVRDVVDAALSGEAKLKPGEGKKGGFLLLPDDMTPDTIDRLRKIVNEQTKR